MTGANNFELNFKTQETFRRLLILLKYTKFVKIVKTSNVETIDFQNLTFCNRLIWHILSTCVLIDRYWPNKPVILINELILTSTNRGAWKQIFQFSLKFSRCGQQSDINYLEFLLCFFAFSGLLFVRQKALKFQINFIGGRTFLSLHNSDRS